MRPLRARAREALGDRHAASLAEALVPTLAPGDVRWAREQLAARARGELRSPGGGGSARVLAPWSSTALVCSAFAWWRRRAHELTVAGLGPFATVRLEERLAIPHGGGSPNLDVALEAPGGGLVGIESKLTEHLSPTPLRPWKPAYHRPAMAAALAPGWRELFTDLRDGRWAPVHAPAGQLVRHALSLRGANDLVYLHWEPANAAEHPEVLAHRAELDDVLERVGTAPPRLHALTWAQLLDEWEPAAPEHVRALRARYTVAVRAAGAAEPRGGAQGPRASGGRAARSA